MGALLLLMMLLGGFRCRPEDEEEGGLPPVDQWGRREPSYGGDPNSLPPQRPIPAAPVLQPTSTQPWPQAVPPNLPAFPSGWTYAEPVTPAVRARAWALLDGLWKRGQGSTQLEMTGGEWITYRAEITANKRKGVVAYRPKTAPGAVQARPGVTPAPLQQRSPGMPQARQPAESAQNLPQPAPGAPAQRTPASSSPLPVPRITQTPGQPPRPWLHQGAGMGALVALRPYVTQVQAVLHVVPVDGQFGAHTREAVKAFQRQHALKDDGIVGDKTWEALDLAARAAKQQTSGGWAQYRPAPHQLAN